MRKKAQCAKENEYGNDKRHKEILNLNKTTLLVCKKYDDSFENRGNYFELETISNMCVVNFIVK